MAQRYCRRYSSPGGTGESPPWICCSINARRAGGSWACWRKIMSVPL